MYLQYFIAFVLLAGIAALVGALCAEKRKAGGEVEGGTVAKRVHEYQDKDNQARLDNNTNPYKNVDKPHNATTHSASTHTHNTTAPTSHTTIHTTTTTDLRFNPDKGKQHAVQPTTNNNKVTTFATSNDQNVVPGHPVQNDKPPALPPKQQATNKPAASAAPTHNNAVVPANKPTVVPANRAPPPTTVPANQQQPPALPSKPTTVVPANKPTVAAQANPPVPNKPTVVPANKPTAVVPANPPLPNKPTVVAPANPPLPNKPTAAPATTATTTPSKPTSSANKVVAPPIAYKPPVGGNPKINSLMVWCQQSTQGYSHVNITNFTTAWKDGMAFCALIHHYNPCFDYDSLSPSNPAKNLKLAIDLAEKMGIPRLCDPEDFMELEVPDRLSTITFLFEWSNKLNP